MRETILTNARIVLPDAVLAGSVVLRDGLIAAVEPGASRAGEDLDGDYLLPGLVELHTDHLEGHYAPRPKVRWDPVAAVLAHDAQLATAGITTVFDTVRAGHYDEEGLGLADMRALADGVEHGMARGVLRAEHFLHLRCEVSASDCLPAFESLMSDRSVRMVSLMDHAPGQRQFAAIDAYAAYYMGKLKMTQEAFDAYCAKRRAESAANSGPNRAAITAACRATGVVLASHDDATAAHVAEAVAQGVRVAEFPTTVEAAQACNSAGLVVMMGAPNVMRGGSHSGNVSANELARAGLLDILSSDYVPYSLIQAAFFLGSLDWIGLPTSVGMVSRVPAEAVGLTDRGAILPGRRADLVRVRQDGAIPVVRAVWREGLRVA